MAATYTTPGVYREDVHVLPAVSLPTGVPGFVGFADTGGSPVALRRLDELASHVELAATSYLADALAGFFANGGVQCYVVGASGGGEQGLTSALERLGPLTDLDLVAVPDAATLPADAARGVQAAAIAHCTRHGDRFAILDAPPGKDPAMDVVEEFQTWRRQLTVGLTHPANAAVYYPWLKVAAAETAGGRPVPPCGHVAGIYARSDARVGVHKAPANEEILGVLDLEFPIDAEIQDGLNPQGINCLRAFRGRGLRVWGARTLSHDPNWRYVNVRRLFLTLARWIDRNLAWAAFEPNTPRLWVRIQRELTVYLEQVWRSGALRGATAPEAFYVRCDADTNPAGEREQGRVTTEIGLAAAFPAEFIVVRIFHRAGGAELKET